MNTILRWLSNVLRQSASSGHSRRLLAALGACGLVASVQAVMLAGLPAPSAPLPPPLDAWPAPDLRGVARLSNGCSAVLLQGSRHLLGAAHCAAGPASTASLGSGETVTIVAVQTAPGWGGSAAVHDLAVMTLQAAATTPGYGIASADLATAMPAVLVAGYGGSGTPVSPQAAGSLRHGYNEYDAPFWPAGVAVPADGPRVRLFDFDDGSLAANTLGLRPGGTSSLGLGEHEAMLAGMDSGGPSLVPVKETGWRSLLPGAAAWRWEIAAIHVGIDGRRGSNFGGIGMDLLVGPYRDWIHSIVAAP